VLKYLNYSFDEYISCI